LSWTPAKNGAQAQWDCFVNDLTEIILTTINAKWIHPSLALRLLKANLGSLEDSCEIIEFALRQPLAEKIQPLLDASPRILGVSVSIWNHTAAIELLEELNKRWSSHVSVKPAVVLGGPEVSHLPQNAGIFKYADYVIRGEGETAFRTLCENILVEKESVLSRFIDADNVDVSRIKSAYHLYTEEDIAKKLIYVEASRGCPFKCEFCLSAKDSSVREFPLDVFLSDMDILISRGVKTFKYLDRSFNVNIKRAIKIIEFFLYKIEKFSLSSAPFTVHFEMVPSLFPPELLRTLSRFPLGTLRLEIGIQTLNKNAASLIGRASDPEKELESLRLLAEETNAIIHADLIAGLPGEDIVSFGSGFDRLWAALYSGKQQFLKQQVEIQLGMLKLLPGTPVSRHREKFGMRYNSSPPYEIEETSTMSGSDLARLRNFSRFWEIIVNRGLVFSSDFSKNGTIFCNFLELSDTLFAYFGRNWGIDRGELLAFLRIRG